ncbi:hypothetical protein [Pseudarthrobacter sp. LT1]|uniref:hypothetical protein n=1 Tax=Pseudarthrobacter sp. LT1 TaxID=3111450 RepID=UPI002D76E878|nr:hypothetical protein [Pseudarthrobacter sp. LT1]WRT14697.1 hypothetical protein VIK36_04160 [Pseudarthrobacter sp. LT1]
MHQAIKGRAKTTAVRQPARRSNRKGKEPIAADVLATAVELARRDRIQQDIRDYAHRKGGTA